MKPNKYPLIAAILAGPLAALFTSHSARAQSTYTWANSNVTATPAASLNWFNATQGTWTEGTPVSGNANTIQFFANTTTALTNTGGSGNTQASIVDNGGNAFQLGTLTLSGLASSTTGANLTMNISGDALNFSAATGTINLNALNATRTISYNVANHIQLGTVSSNGALTFTGAGTGNFTFSGNISELKTGGGSIVKSGSSTLTLSGTNSYTGGTIVNAGTLNINSSSALGTGTLTINTNNTTFGNTSGGLISITNNITSTNNTIFAGTNALTTSGSYSYNSTARTLTVNGSGVLTVGALAINGGSTGLLRKAGTGTLAITRASSVPGVEFGASGGVVIAGNAASLGTGNLAVINGGSGTLQSSVALTGASKIANGVTLTGTAALTLSGSNNFEIGGAITSTTTSGSITKSGANTVILSGANTYTGTTSVNDGTLRLTGSLGNTAVTVANTATIAGEGSIGATGSLTFNNGSSLRVDASTAGALTVGSGATGNLALAATTTVVLDTVPAATGTGTSIRLINYNGTLTGSAANLALANAADYRNAVFSTATAKQVNLSIDTKALTWSGASASWDINSSLTWDSGAEKFYQGDSVTFTDSGTTKEVTLAATVTPASVTFNNTTGNNYSLSGGGSIVGSSALTKTGSGTVTISNTNTYTGSTTISGGTLETDTSGINGSDSTNGLVFGSGTLKARTSAGINTSKAITATGTILLNTTNGAITLSGNIASTTSGLTLNGGNTLTLSGTNSYSGGTTISGGKIVATAAGALGSGGVTNNATLDLTAGAVNYTGLSTSMSGNGTVNVTLGSGTATTTLNGNYSGFAGTWNIGSGAAASAGKVNMTGADNASATINVLSNGTLYVSSSANTHNASLVLYGGNTGESLGQLRLEGGATWAGDITLAGAITGSGDATVGSNSGGGIISGDISESGGSQSLIKAGSSVITLSGSNSYTGLTTINAGTFKLGSTSALGSATIKTSGVEVNGTAVFDLAGISPTAVAPLTLNSTAATANVGSLHNSANGTTATYSGAVTLQAATVVVGGGDTGSVGNITLTGAITGNDKNLNKNGLGLLNLSNNGTVNLGTLQVYRGGIEVGSGTTINAAGLNIGSGAAVGGALNLNGGSITVPSSGTVSLSTNTSTTTTVTLGAGSTLTVPNFNKGNGGTALVFNLNGGTLKANAASTTFMSSNAATTAKVQAGGAVIDDGNLAITIGQALTHDSTLGASADGGLTKKGSGTLTLSGTNTYTGATLITEGTLKLQASGSIDSTSYISLGTSGTLDVSAKSQGYTVESLKGSGNVTGELTVSTQLAIGNSAGTTHFSSSLTLGSASTYLYELTGGENPGADSADLGEIAGALTINDGSILDLVQLGTYTANNKFTLFAYDGILNGTFRDASANVLEDGATFTDAGGIWMIDYNDTIAGANGGISASNTYVTITAVPEPNVATLLNGLGVLALLRRSRVRR